MELQRGAVTDRDPGRLLPTMLQGVEAEIGEAGDRQARGVDADHAALLARTVGLVERQLSRWAGTDHASRGSQAGTPASLQPGTRPGGALFAIRGREYGRGYCTRPHFPPKRCRDGGCTSAPGDQQAMADRPHRPHPAGSRPAIIERFMLRFARALGFLAPIAVALCLSVVVSLVTEASDRERTVLLTLVALSVVAGMTTTALIAWSYFGWRLNRIARALETTLELDAPIHLRESGVPAERRLAQAFNAAAGAFLQVEARATHDRLTGIANRETLLIALGAEIERATRHYKPLSVAFIDIDRFKPVNDTYGHNSGDAVLHQVAGLIADNIRTSDMCGRYGGEEFMLILPETTSEEAVVLAEKLRAIVMADPLQIADGQRLGVTISIGIAGGRGSELQLDTPGRPCRRGDVRREVARPQSHLSLPRP